MRFAAWGLSCDDDLVLALLRGDCGFVFRVDIGTFVEDFEVSVAVAMVLVLVLVLISIDILETGCSARWMWIGWLGLSFERWRVGAMIEVTRFGLGSVEEMEI